MDEPAWIRRLGRAAERLDDAIARQDKQAALAVKRDLLAAASDLEPRHQPEIAELAGKTIRNEIIRVWVRNGWYTEAADLVEESIGALRIDAFCPNREAVLRQARARIWMAAGDLDTAYTEMNRAIDGSRAFLALEDAGWQRQPDRCKTVTEGSCPTCAGVVGPEAKGPRP